MERSLRAFYIAVLMFAGRPLTAQDLAPPLQSGPNRYSLEKEAALGKQLAAELRERMSPIDVPVVQNFLDQLGKSIAALMPDAKLPFTFTPIAEDPCLTTHEPVAMPGGYIFVPAALFLAARDEAEFAGMLVHAMEHVTQRHEIRQAGGGAMASIPLIFAGGWGGGCSEGVSIPVGFIASQRTAELEADRGAVQTMALAGFDPEALVRYIQRVQPPSDGTAKGHTSVPDRDSRVAAIRSAIEKLPSMGVRAMQQNGFAAAREEMRPFAQTPLVRPDTQPTLLRKSPR